MNTVLAVSLLLLSAFLSFTGGLSYHRPANKIFNVMTDYGAVPDGVTDSTEAFRGAWEGVCAWEGPGARLVIPMGKFLVGPLEFKGPCKGKKVEVKVRGDVLAQTDLNLYTARDWISFKYLNGLVLYGKGKFDGRGASAWAQNDCDRNKNCKHLPWSLGFSFVTNSTIRGITSVDSKSVHMQIFACNNLHLHSLKLIAPADSPNTDGIHVGVSRNIHIARSFIGTGDDCISIGPDTANLSVSKVFCGPGHGISIGSLGRDKEEGDVTGISVKNCTFADTTNGVRIKTWEASPTPSSAYNLKFEDLVMRNVDNPIVIDQKYCPHNHCNTKGGPSLVKISDVKFRNIRGETRTKTAINLVCSDSVPCEDIELSDIKLKYNVPGDYYNAAVDSYNTVVDSAVASCTNVKGRSKGTVIPPSCV
ncbi:hypothetical protein KSP39_PZI014735 [Platanthera zijinensis]|uniref:Exopolygalacturonase n=1 Tax=Platanthera zijinensis TaxID=2320716 RepID=A0AAP0BB12_9ASPA